ncbi:MAG: hemolysin family protein [Spirochaetes bacterium]|nr:hemolysin family protein [Spirochaetota bacterium]
MIVEFAAIVVLLFFSAFFSIAEIAFTSLSPIQLDALAEKRGRSGKLIKKILKDPERFLTTVLGGSNLCNITVSVITTKVTLELFGDAVIGVMTGIITLLILIFGEVVPKNVGLARNEMFAVLCAPLVSFFIIVFMPFVFFITLISRLVIKMFGKNQKNPITTDAILRLVKYADAQGVLDDYETEMVHAVFRLDQQNISSIMTHRTEVFSLEKNSLVKDVIGLINSDGHSRIPVYEKNQENIAGIVLVKDIVKRMSNPTEDVSILKLSDIMIPPFFVHGNKKIKEVLFLMQKEKRKMVVVLDEYGGLAGIVTMEDIAEEIIGKLYDERDSLESEKIISIDEFNYLVQGNALISAVNDKLGINLPIGKFSQTIGGYVIDEIGRIPKKREKISFENVLLTVNSVSATKINSIIITIIKE